MVGCVSGRRAATARQIVAIGTIAYIGNHGGELLRPGATRPEVDPELAAWTRRVRAFAHARIDTGASAPARAQRGQGRDRRLPLARRARRGGRGGRGRRDRASSPSREGFVVHWGRKVLEVRPPVDLDKGSGIARLLSGGPARRPLYVGDDTTDLDAFPALRTLVAAGVLDDALCVAVSSDEAPPELAREADLTVDGPGGVRGLLEALL